MTLTAAERGRLRLLWRRLSVGALGADPAELKDPAREALGWASPCDRPGDAFVLFALARLAFAFVREPTEAGRAARRPALSGLALLAGEVLDATDPGEPPPPPPPTLPFRADLDG